MKTELVKRINKELEREYTKLELIRNSGDINTVGAGIVLGMTDGFERVLEMLEEMETINE